MQQAHPFTFQEFKDELPDTFVQTMALIHVALASGVVIFLAFVLYRILGSGDTARAAAPVFSLVHACLFVPCTAMGFFLFDVLRRRAYENRTSVGAYLAQLQAATLVRLALLEGAALFGLVTLFLLPAGAFREQPLYWLNLASSMVFLLTIAATFPTRSRLEGWVRQQRR